MALAVGAGIALALLAAVPSLAQPAAGQAGVCYAVTGVVDGARLFTIDLATGSATLIGAVPGGYALPAVAISPAGALHATNLDPDLLHVDATDASFDSVGTLTGYEIQGMEYDAGGTLWGIDQTARQLVTIDPATAAVTVVVPIGDDMSALAFDPTDGTLWAAASGEADVRDGIYTIDPTTGATTLVGQTGRGGATPGLCFDAAGNFYAVKGGGGKLNDLVSLDKATGAATVIGSTGLYSVSGLTFLATPGGSATGVETVAAAGAGAWPRLAGAGPTPFRGRTVIALDLPRAGDVRLDVHEVTGRLVRTLIDGPRPAGRSAVAWDGRGAGGAPAPAGVYLVRMESAGVRDAVKVVLLR